MNSPELREKLFAGLPLMLLFLIAAIALLWKLGGGSLAAWDEAIYAQVSKEVLQSGDWLTLHWQSALWFEKPPLFMWVTSFVYSIFGISEFSARLPSALSGLGLLAVTYLTGCFAYAKRVGLIATAILLSCYHFLSYSRFGTMEIMLTLVTFVAVYGYLRTTSDERWWYLAGSACALALMIKGAGGIVAPAAIVLSLIFDRRFAAIRSRHFWMACLLAAVIVLPWHLLMWARFGQQFTAEYLGYHVIARATTTLEGHPSSYLYYVGRIIDGFFPLVLLVPFAIISEIRNRKKNPAGSWIVLTLVVFVFLFYTLIPTRRPWYIVPVYPALAILIAAFVERFWKAFQLRPAYRRIIAIAFALVLVAGGLYSVASLALNRKPAEPIATLSRQAQRTAPADRAPLILLPNKEHYYAQVPLFYSDRPVLQTYESSPPPPSQDAKRYVSFTRLADVVGDSEQPIIFPKIDTEVIAQNYQLRVIAEDRGLVYGMIKRKR